MIRRHNGFSLIEIIVGLLIGLIVTIVIFQVFEVSERQKRTTVGASDAQGNGAIAINMLGQHARSAGAGLDYQLFSQCSGVLANIAGTSPGETAAALSSVVSITRNDGDAGSDSISMLHYISPNSDNGDTRYATLMLTEDKSVSASDISTRAVRNCDPRILATTALLAMMIEGSTCALITVTGSSSSDDPNGNIQKSPGRGFNFPASYTGHTFGKYKTSLQCLPGLYRTTWRIRNQQLEVENADLGAPPLGNALVTKPPTSVVAPNIVALKAQYGVVPAEGEAGKAIQWVNADNEWAGIRSPLGVTMAASDLVHVRRIKAIRVAILVRNEEYQKPSPGGCNATTDTQTANWPSWANFSTGGLGGDWDCYRYKALESTIPIRNLLWMK
ncbi:MAG: PilW family protein [Zoogloeaceae bacterium]|nr:PilW family protein [Zoogloeaceae bacterium]